MIGYEYVIIFKIFLRCFQGTHPYIPISSISIITDWISYYPFEGPIVEGVQVFEGPTARGCCPGGVAVEWKGTQ